MKLPYQLTHLAANQTSSTTCPSWRSLEFTIKVPKPPHKYTLVARKQAMQTSGSSIGRKAAGDIGGWPASGFPNNLVKYMEHYAKDALGSRFEI